MKFNIIDTQTIYRRLLAEPDAQTREAIYRAELVAPYEGMIQIFGGGDGLALFRQWSLCTPEDFAGENRETIAAILDKLAAFGAWDKAAQALEDGRKAFAPYEDRIPLGTIQFGLFVADFQRMMPGSADRGYTGFGGIPGYIMTVYSQPNEYNLARLQGATVHELLHNVAGSFQPFNPMTITVGEYMIGEGLAESFSTELYGEGVAGFYVTDFDEAQLEQAKCMVKEALNETGFDTVRSYIFGDTISAHMGRTARGVPDYAGYAIGYRVVQQYLRRTRKTVPEAVFVPAGEIIRESGFFEG